MSEMAHWTRPIDQPLPAPRDVFNQEITGTYYTETPHRNDHAMLSIYKTKIAQKFVNRIAKMNIFPLPVEHDYDYPMTTNSWNFLNHLAAKNGDAKIYRPQGTNKKYQVINIHNVRDYVSVVAKQKFDSMMGDEPTLCYMTAQKIGEIVSSTYYTYKVRLDPSNGVVHPTNIYEYVHSFCFRDEFMTLDNFFTFMMYCLATYVETSYFEFPFHLLVVLFDPFDKDSEVQSFDVVGVRGDMIKGGYGITPTQCYYPVWYNEEF